MRRAKLRTKIKMSWKPSTTISFVFLLICFFCWYFLREINNHITPKLVEIATRNVEKLTYNIFNDFSSLSKMEEEELKNLLIIQKNKNDEIINISYDTKKSYNAVDKIVSQIKQNYQMVESGEKYLEYYDEELSKLEDGLILNLPIGLASDKIFFANLGPRIPVKVKFMGTLIANLKTKIQNYGINNVLIELYIDVSLTHEIMTPVTFKQNKLDYEILLNAEVITGQVPSYYGGTYENKSNILPVPIE